jgi:hypothetical protein
MSIQFYTEVNPKGYVSKSMFTTDIEGMNPLPGYRLLPDNPPNPPAYISGKSKPVRIEPVPLDATEIPYEIVEEKTITEDQMQVELVDIINQLTE